MGRSANAAAEQHHGEQRRQGHHPREALGVLRVANRLDLATLRKGVRLTKSAAQNLLSRRDGPDAVRGTADDRPFASLRDLSSVCNIGSSAIHSLLLWAMAHGEVSPADAGVAVVDAGMVQPDPFSPALARCASRRPTTSSSSTARRRRTRAAVTRSASARPGRSRGTARP